MEAPLVMGAPDGSERRVELQPGNIWLPRGSDACVRHRRDRL